MRIYIWGTGGVASDYLETNEVKVTKAGIGIEIPAASWKIV